MSGISVFTLIPNSIGSQIEGKELTNERGEAWLNARGFRTEEEPAWVKEGRTPDFYCEGLAELWVEVKTLGSAERFENLADAHVLLKKQSQRIPGNGIKGVGDKRESIS